MSSDAVMPAMRAHGWNIQFLAGPRQSVFAGLFHPPDSDTLRYRDVVDELRLCFYIVEPGPSDDEPSDPWGEVTFWHAGFVNAGTKAAPPTPAVIWGQHLDQPVSAPPSDPSAGLSCPPRSCFHIVRHTECDIALTEPLTAHLQAGCATHIPYPSLRRDDRYLYPERGSKDPGFTRLPYRNTTRSTRRSQLPLYPSASASVSPTEDIGSGFQDADSDTVETMVVPPTMDIMIKTARETMTAFHDSCLVSSSRCAVTGKGRSWFACPAVGPALQACHIVPQQHYHVYPVTAFASDDIYSARRLCEAWKQTWSAKNSILLLSHLHEFFDARLFSIHPETLRIRVFVPYDVISDYHGSIAQLSWMVNRKALRHHYEMSCIENMTAKMPLDRLHLMPQLGARSGTVSPSISRSNIPIIPGMNTTDDSDEFRLSQGSSASRLPWEGHGLSQQAAPGAGVKHTLEEGDDGRLKKRQRISSGEETAWDSDEDYREEYRHPGWEGCVTPWNHRVFLADVNYELGKYQYHNN